MKKYSVMLHISGIINHIWLSFMVNLCEIMTFRGIFFIFSKFWFSGLLQGWKGKRWSKMRKNYVCHVPYLKKHTYDFHLWYTYMCKMITSTGIFFIFLKILIFWVVRGVKGQKVVQNKKKLYLTCYISQETYIIWFSFMVHICKIITSTGVFSIFSKFWFSGLLGG